MRLSSFFSLHLRQHAKYCDEVTDSMSILLVTDSSFDDELQVGMIRFSQSETTGLFFTDQKESRCNVTMA